MIRILSLVVSLSFFLGSFSLCFAGAPYSETCFQKMRTLMGQRLDMTDEQRTEVFSILSSAKKERREFVKELRTPSINQEKRLELHAKIKEVDVASRAELVALLSDDQMKKFDQIILELREKILSSLK